MFFDDEITTFYDTPEYSPPHEIYEQYEHFRNNPIIQELIEGMPELVVILNKNRQIVTGNSIAVKTIKASSLDEILGLRFGEALNCIHRAELEGGCGTSKFCRECGAAHAIKRVNDEGIQSIEECRISADSIEGEISYDFRVYTKPLIVEGGRYVLFAIRDVADEKRRQALERIFFHDVLNTSGAIVGLVNLIASAEDDEEREELLPMLASSSQQLVQEIISQKDLRNAENGTLSADMKDYSAGPLLQKVYNLYNGHELAQGINLAVEIPSDPVSCFTDSMLLVRSLGNLCKNALEASEPGQTVTLFLTADDDHVTFNVRNETVIPEHIQLQMFKRSFSTKSSSGRGIGTYSVKLLVEQHMQGKVFFISDSMHGTIFSIRVPDRDFEKFPLEIDEPPRM